MGGGLAFMQSVVLRSLLAALTAFVASLLVGPSFIQYLRRQQVAQIVRQEECQNRISANKGRQRWEVF